MIEGLFASFLNQSTELYEKLLILEKVAKSFEYDINLGGKLDCCKFHKNIKLKILYRTNLQHCEF